MNWWASTLLCVAIAIYSLCHSVDAKLTVHIAPHTHDDVGWLKTVDEYFYGANNTIQVAQVQYILDTVVTALLTHPARKFIYVEMAFFWRWWREQTPERQADVKMLVKEGRLEFINGGWCMNDEASTHYESIVDQMTLGHRFLLDTFGVTPKVAWHIDPFGHSSAQAALFANTGFEAFMFARIDYQDRQNRWATQGMEFLWRGSQSLGPASDIFTSVLYSGYGMPPGFSFESANVDPIMDDPYLEGYNVEQRADAFAAFIATGSAVYKTEHFYIPFGTDFYFANAELVFKNIDKLMGYIQAHPERYNFNIIYSTPSIYIEAVRAANTNWTLKTDDLFPYADRAHSYWTGYFTSRPAFKHYERDNNALLQAITRLYVSTQTNDQAIVEQIFSLQEAMGIAQHHDAVSGTEKQHVANDYAKRLSIGATAVQSGFSTILGNLFSKGSTQKPSFSFCPLLNESMCPPTQTKLGQGQVLPVVLYNSLAWERVESIHLPVSQTNLQVLDRAGQPINSQVFPSLTHPGSFNLAFRVLVGPLSATTVFVSATAASSSPAIASTKLESPDADIVLENEVVKATFDGTTGGIKTFQNKRSNIQINVAQEYLYYLPSVGDSVSNQASGAYIFRPAVEQTFPFGSSTPTVSVVRGIIVQEIRRQFNPYLTQIVRLYNFTSHLEYIDMLGPIPMNGTEGKEVITRFHTNINSTTNWWTDANGLDMQPRVRNFRPTWKLNVTDPTAGNYYPSNAAFFINDAFAQLTFTTDRSRGVASLANGQVESMLNRACSKDDSKGVGEVLNEQNVIISTQFASLEPPAIAAASFRAQAKHLAHPLLPSFAAVTDLKTYLSNYNTEFSPMTAPLPANVQLLSLVPLTSNTAILRLHHIFAVREDATLSQPVTVGLSKLFRGFTITTAEEYTLTASKKSTTHPLPADLTVTLKPMEIRTFIVQFAKNAISSNVRIA